MRRKTILASLFGLVVLAIAAAWFVFVGLNATRYLLFARADARSRDEIEAMLKRIHLPEGFSIALYAQAPGARSLAVGAKGEAIFVGTADDRVHVLTQGDGRAASVDVLAPEMKFVMPHGVCFSREGVLFVVERNKITRFDEAETNWRQAASRARVIVPAGDLIPRAEQSGNHSARVCRVGPEAKLYVSLGQPYNVTPREKLVLYDRLGIGGIIRMN